MDATHLVGIGVIAFIGWQVWSGDSQPPPSIAGKEVVHYEPTQFHVAAAPESADAVLAVRSRTGDLLGQGYLDHWGVIHQTDEQRTNGAAVLSVEPQAFLSRWWYESGPPYIDAGGFLGLAHSGDIAPGLRLSPARYLYGSVAPDLLITERSLGLGISLYPPARSVGYGWSHIGVELGYLRHTRGGGPDGFVLGLSTAIQ